MISRACSDGADHAHGTKITKTKVGANFVSGWYLGEQDLSQGGPHELEGQVQLGDHTPSIKLLDDTVGGEDRWVPQLLHHGQLANDTGRRRVGMEGVKWTGVGWATHNEGTFL
jgi:hypothetical protein